MGAGILPITFHNGSFLLLLGLEHFENNWSDFGGSCLKNESNYNCAIREGYEELNGFLGNKNELKKIIDKNLITIFNNNNNTYSSYLFYINYDENLPKYFNYNFKFLKKNHDKIIDKNGFFEKKKIKWFTIDELKKLKNIRVFYKNIIDQIIDNYDIIMKIYDEV